MKYTYAYKTSDGVRHEAAMEAPSREEVFATLRERGIRAIKVVAADGSKANGEVQAIRASWFALRGSWALLGVLALTLVGIGIAYRAGEVRGTNHDARGTTHDARTAPRHQIYGDPAVMAAFEQGDFSGVFEQPGDQLLAWFAQPGKLMCPPNANAVICTDKMASNLLAVARLSLLPKSENDAREIVELKQIVNGMREELRAYLANGNGTVYSYWRRLHERLAEERQIYARTKSELEADPSPALRDERNAALRALGLRTIPQPKK